MKHRNWLAYSESKDIEDPLWHSVYWSIGLSSRTKDLMTRKFQTTESQHKNSSRHKSSILNLKGRSEIGGQVENFLQVQVYE